jgi:hypothetical protein
LLRKLQNELMLEILRQFRKGKAPVDSPFDGSSVDLRMEFIVVWLLTGNEHLMPDPFPKR